MGWPLRWSDRGPGTPPAAHTVDPQHRVHSLHAYFIRRGDHGEPIRFEVDRLRNGRSFVTRAVVARQSTGAILNMSASFQVDESGPEIDAAEMPMVPSHDAVADDSWIPFFDRRIVVGEEQRNGTAAMWFSMRGRPLDDPVARACALAYCSDDLPADAVRSRRLQAEPSATDAEWFGTSLDHAIWFHRPLASSRWYLHHFTCQGLLGSRGLATGHVFDADGTLLATVAQEVLMRRRSPASR